MTARQKKVARHTLDVLTVLLILLGLWLASGIKETHVVHTHSNTAPVVVVEAPSINV